MAKEKRHMEFKLNKNYPELLFKYIVDKEQANEIQCNIDFAEKYIDKIDDYFSNNKERQIAYKQLGVIVFSCVEALWKNIVLGVNKNCEIQNCKENCKYRKFETLEKLNKASAQSVLAHLINMRLLYVHPAEEEAIKHLQNLRNYVHLTRAWVGDDKSLKFNKQFIEDMLRLYFVTINQFEMYQSELEMYHKYRDKSQSCMRKLVGNNYELTEQLQEYARKEYYTNHALRSCLDIFYKKPITEKNERILRHLSKPEDFDIKKFIYEISQWLHSERIHFRSEVDYQKALKNFAASLQAYLPHDSNLLAQIDNQIEKRSFFW